MNGGFPVFWHSTYGGKRGVGGYFIVWAVQPIRYNIRKVVSNSNFLPFAIG